MPTFNVDPKSATPIYAQLDRSIRAAIATGTLAPGSQLPTVRQLAVDLAVNANTVARVYAQLERDGILETQRGVGTFVRESPSPQATRAHRERELRALIQRFVGDAALLGFTLPELISQLRNEEKKYMPGMDEVLAARRAARASRGQARTNVVAVFILIVSLLAGVMLTASTQNPVWLIIGVLAAVFLSQSPKIAKQWERAVVLRLGKYTGLRGPGLFWITPFVETVTIYVDQRVVTTSFAAEETLTSDTVPVNVDAVLFWMVHDSEKAALEVQDYTQAVSWAAQTGLRDIIGRTSLSELLRGRERIESELQALIDQRSNPWGVTVQSVEMRDIVIPASLQDAMSREAQASREKSARIILGQAEVEIAHLFFEAAKSYENNPTALHLRAMNILYEGLKEKGALMVVPSNVVESMGLGGMLGAAALRQQGLGQTPPQAAPPTV